MTREGAFESCKRRRCHRPHCLRHVLLIESARSHPNHNYRATGILKSAAREQRIKRFVYTSSSTAATIPKPGKKFEIDRNTWDDEAVRDAWAPPPYNADRAFYYMQPAIPKPRGRCGNLWKSRSRILSLNCVNPNANLRALITP